MQSQVASTVPSELDEHVQRRHWALITHPNLPHSIIRGFFGDSYIMYM